MYRLWENEVPYFTPEYGQTEPALVPYLLKDGEVHPCVIVFPGGGYSGRANHEGEPIAQWLNSIGIHAFVLEYRVAPYTYKAILRDAVRSVRFVRCRAAEFGIDPGKIGVLGFSAGGHLALMTALRYMDAECRADDPIDSVSGRPDLAVLCYPVVSFVSYFHEGSMNRFLGEEPTWELRQKFAGEKAVTPDAPPMFIWHTAEDGSVPVENSIQLALSLREKRVPFALHVYPYGTHGKALARDLYQTELWTEECTRWLFENFEMEERG